MSYKSGTVIRTGVYPHYAIPLINEFAKLVGECVNMGKSNAQTNSKAYLTYSGNLKAMGARLEAVKVGGGGIVERVIDADNLFGGSTANSGNWQIALRLGNGEHLYDQRIITKS